MLRFPVIALGSALLFFAWGVATAQFKWFPWSLIAPIEQEIREFVQGDASEQTGITEKLANDLSIRPSRQLFDYQPNPSRDYVEFPIPRLKDRRDAPRLFVNDNGGYLKGYRFIFGSFDFDTHLHGAILLNPDNELVNYWVVDEDHIKKTIQAERADNPDVAKYKPAARRLPQGVIVMRDGSIVFNDGDRGNGMHRMDRCGKTMWTSTGHYHHSITLDQDDQTLWTFGPQDMMQLDPESGAILKTISLEQLHRANPDLSVFTMRRDLSNGVWHYDPIHKNDIESLTNEHLSSFPQFERGDLLVSHRSSNLVFVFDPDTLKIKWWRAGQTRRQHDPDWQNDGSITIFDNNLKENFSEEWDGALPDLPQGRFSRIFKLFPQTYGAEIIYDGEADDMYSGERSKHQILPNGNILMTSAHQGRILEVTGQGETVFELINQYDQSQSLILSEAIWLPPNYFQVDFADREGCLK